MRVVSMALIETSYYVLFVTSMALALASQWMIGLVYLNAVILFVMLYLQIAAIPLNLNWSRNFRTPDMGVRIYATPGAW